MRDRILLALKCISRRYISHVIYDTWGDKIYIMKKKGNAIACIYWYHDDNTAIYFEGLHVSEHIRFKGVGTELQEMREKIGIALGVEYSFLWVEKDTWMHSWYERRGYKDYHDKDRINENTVWMRKSLK